MKNEKEEVEVEGEHEKQKEQEEIKTKNHKYLNLSHFQSIIEQLVFCVNSKFFPTYNAPIIIIIININHHNDTGNNNNNTTKNNNIIINSTLTRKVDYFNTHPLNITKAHKILLVVAPLLLHHPIFITHLAIMKMLSTKPTNETTKNKKTFFKPFYAPQGNAIGNDMQAEREPQQHEKIIESLKNRIRLPPSPYRGQRQQRTTAFLATEPSPLLDLYHYQQPKLPKLLKRQLLLVASSIGGGGEVYANGLFKQFVVIIVSIIDFIFKFHCFQLTHTLTLTTTSTSTFICRLLLLTALLSALFLVVCSLFQIFCCCLLLYSIRNSVTKTFRLLLSLLLQSSLNYNYYHYCQEHKCNSNRNSYYKNSHENEYSSFDNGCNSCQQIHHHHHHYCYHNLSHL